MNSRRRKNYSKLEPERQNNWKSNLHNEPLNPSSKYYSDFQNNWNSNLHNDPLNPSSKYYSEIVVNPTTKTMNNNNNNHNNNHNNLLHDVTDPYTKKYNTFVKTVTPNLGKCEQTGNWENEAQVEDCETCLDKSSPEYPYFYCDGLCTSKYELGGGQCALNSLVAKNKKQCKKPCKQYKPPSMSSGCQDDFDCAEDETCSKSGSCIKTDKSDKSNKPQKLFKKIKLEDIKLSETTLLNILKICGKNKNTKNCIEDLRSLNCDDIIDLVKKNIKESHKNGSYKTERENIIKTFNTIKKSTEREDKEYNKLVDTIHNMNCVIDEINHQYELDDNEKIKPMNITDQKAHYISKIIKEDTKTRNIFDVEKLLGIDNCKFYLFSSIILFVIVILLLIFYRKNNVKDLNL